jgi:hypothetical protein
MSSLRRDLFERRLWPVIALLLVAVVAVPLMLRKNARAEVAAVPPAPPVAGAVPPASRTIPPASARALRISMPRDPFASGMPKLNTKPESKTTTAGTPPAATTTGTSPTTSTPSMVSPSPTTPSTGSSPTPSTTPTTVTTTTTTTTPGASLVPTIRSWTVYAVSLRVGTGRFAPLQSDVARLTPLPSVTQPKAMFMGVMADGRHVVFALGAGVQHAGPGVCRPDRTRCAAIVLRVGQTEQIIAPVAGGPRQLNISVVHIASHVTHSRDDALAAFQRHSAAGLCELNLGAPVAYSQGAGTVSPVAAAACRHRPRAVPFPGGLAAP